MISRIDGFALLQAIVQNAAALADLRAEAWDAGRTLLLRHVRAAAPSCSGLREVFGILGRRGLALLLDDLSERELRALVNRLDRHEGRRHAFGAAELRAHLLTLAEGTEPAPGPAARAPAPGRAASVFSPAFAATWDGRDRS